MITMRRRHQALAPVVITEGSTATAETERDAGIVDDEHPSPLTRSPSHLPTRLRCRAVAPSDGEAGASLTTRGAGQRSPSRPLRPCT